MKKKQKQKLLNQFRPSLDGVRGQLFRSLEDESLRRYGLPLQVMLDPKNRQILTIGLAGKQMKIHESMCLSMIISILY